MSINGKGTGKGIKMLIGVRSLSEEQLRTKYSSRMRCARQKVINTENGQKIVHVPGKTERDHKSGAWKQRFTHRLLRDAFTRMNPLDGRARMVNENWAIGSPAPAM